MKSIARLLMAFMTLTFLGAFSIKAADKNSNTALLANYEKVRAALANDDFETAKKEGGELEKKAIEAKNELIGKYAKEFTKSESLDKARDHFKAISQEAIKLTSGKSEYIVMTCPMANADWIQTNQKVENPYMGKKMLGCGSPKPGKQSSAKTSSETTCVSMPCCR